MKFLSSLLISTFVNFAYSHVKAYPSTAVEGTYFTTLLRVPHGCGNSSTVKVIINYDEELIKAETSFTPQMVAGWKATRVVLPGSKPGTPSESGDGVPSVGATYSDGEIPHDMYGDFGIYFKVPLVSSISRSRNGTVYFPVNQLCKDGVWQNWTTPGDGKFPPAQVKITSQPSSKSDSYQIFSSLPLVAVGFAIAISQ